MSVLVECWGRSFGIGKSIGHKVKAQRAEFTQINDHWLIWTHSAEASILILMKQGAAQAPVGTYFSSANNETQRTQITTALGTVADFIMPDEVSRVWRETKSN
jgi:hypothetical protein